jgi:hypothetical protein
MSRSLCLINPRTDPPSYFSAEFCTASGCAPAALVADVGTATAAAMRPADFEVRQNDENIAPVPNRLDVDQVGLTGKIGRWGRMKSIARTLRERGVIRAKWRNSSVE